MVLASKKEMKLWNHSNVAEAKGLLRRKHQSRGSVARLIDHQGYIKTELQPGEKTVREEGIRCGLTGNGRAKDIALTIAVGQRAVGVVHAQKCAELSMGRRGGRGGGEEVLLQVRHGVELLEVKALGACFFRHCRTDQQRSRKKGSKQARFFGNSFF